MSEERPKLYPITSQTSSSRKQTNAPLSSTPLPLTSASGRQHESRNIFAEGEGGFFFSCPLMQADMVMKVWESLTAQTGVTIQNLQSHFLIVS